MARSGAARGRGGGVYIKQDYVDASKNFWQQHITTTTEEAKYILERPYPHVRDFKKLSVSPSNTRPQSYQRPVLSRRSNMGRKHRR